MKAKAPRSFYVHSSSEPQYHVIKNKTDGPMVYNGQQIKMKKIMIVLGIVAAFFSATAFITSDKMNTIPGPGKTCIEVGNCTVELSGPNYQNKYYIHTHNKNSYAVTVYWSAYGYVNGNRIKVGSGIISSKPYNGGSASTGTDSFTANADNVHLDDIRVSKCD